MLVSEWPLHLHLACGRGDSFNWKCITHRPNHGILSVGRHGQDRLVWQGLGNRLGLNCSAIHPGLIFNFGPHVDELLSL